VISSQVLQSPLQELPAVFCSKCRKRFRASTKELLMFAVNAPRCG
jgi:hypothetical protein